MNHDNEVAEGISQYEEKYRTRLLPEEKVHFSIGWHCCMLADLEQKKRAIEESS